MNDMEFGEGLYIDRLVVEVNQVQRSLFIRRGTTDSQIVGQIFVDNAFSLSGLPCEGKLLSKLSDIRQSGKRPLIVDAGANIGLSAISFVAQVPDSLVVAIEPELGNFRILVANTEGLPILPLPFALGGRFGLVEVTNPSEGEWGYRTHALDKEQAGVDAIPSITVGDILNEFSGAFTPFIVKLDIEGAEKDVFSYDTGWIDKVPLIIVEPHDWMLPGELSFAPFLRAIAFSNRDFVIRGENIFSTCLMT
ncbi:FkbM family methyltransferase [Agrobacterium salinitolerans]|uniref:FkbM family methyltransferase n=1 Tax=Agrobacterium salinitolerans TaxID=1183413 RepID=UPI00098F3D09|nr:FkbM family methyltransferase [Agrobacterium salinitolerans]PNQ23447.1 FkbM family methyltransferase [Rhizobium sp. YIC5082]